jgi:hypothetical protein
MGLLWKQQLATTLEQWRRLVAEIGRQLPTFTVGDITATVDASFKVGVYERITGSG